MAEKSEDLLRIEAENGFVFGDEGSDTAKAEIIGAAICTNPKCDRLNQQITYHADTPQPLHCGGWVSDKDGGRGCFGVLAHAHEYEDTVSHEGTVGAPVKVTARVCTLCGDVQDKQRTALPPLDIASLPAEAFGPHLA